MDWEVATPVKNNRRSMLKHILLMELLELNKIFRLCSSWEGVAVAIAGSQNAPQPKKKKVLNGIWIESQ